MTKDFEVGNVATGTFLLRGQRIPVWLTTYGRFRCEINGATLNASTLDEMRERVMTQLRRQTSKVALPATLIVGSTGVEPITVTGIHASNRSILFRMADGKAASDSYTSRFMGPLTPDEISTYQGMLTEAQNIQQKLRGFEAEHKMDIRAAVEEALTAALAE